MSRDDRPRPSKPKKPATADEKYCAECGLLFPYNKDPEHPRQVGYRKRGDSDLTQAGLPLEVPDGEYRCQDDRSCRARALAIHEGRQLGRPKGKEADWLWLKIPRQDLYTCIDIRPGKPEFVVDGQGRQRLKQGTAWKDEGWKARSSLHERVLALLLYSSKCYPVSFPYAVKLAGLFPEPGRKQMDPDEPLTCEPRYDPIPLRQKDIALAMNERQPKVSDTLKFLVATKRITIDEDGVIAVIAGIGAMTVDERRALYDLPARDGRRGDLNDEERVILGALKRDKGWLRALYARQEEADLSPDEADTCTGIFEEAAKANTRFTDDLTDLRTEKRETYEKLRTQAATLLPELLKMASPTTQAAPAATGQLPQSEPLHDVVEVSVNELYDAGSGRGAMAKVPAREERPGWLVAAKLAEILGESDDPGAARIAAECRKAAPSITDAEIAFFLARNAGRGKGKENPVGLYIRALPPLLKEDTLQRIREEMRLLDQADQVRATRDVETLQQRAYQAYRREYAESAFARMANDERAEARTAKRKALVAEVYFKRMAPDQQSRQVDLWIVKDLEGTAMPFEEWKLRAEGQHA